MIVTARPFCEKAGALAESVTTVPTAANATMVAQKTPRTLHRRKWIASGLLRSVMDNPAPCSRTLIWRSVGCNGRRSVHLVREAIAYCLSKLKR